MCAAHSRHPLSGHTEEAFRPPATFRGGIAAEGLHISFRLQAIKRGINSANRHLTFNAGLDLPSHGHSIGLVIQPKKRQENDVLELAKVIAAGHYLYNIEQIRDGGLNKEIADDFALAVPGHVDRTFLDFDAGSGGDS